MSALSRVVRSGVGRRRVQTVVIGLVVMIAVTAAVLGGSLMVASSAPFERAFAQQNGAHLTAQFDAAKTTAAQLSASANATGVIAAAGPFRTAVITPVTRGRPTRSITVAGRADPGGPVDAIKPTKGRWVTGPGEIVLHNDGRIPESLQPKVGDVLQMPDLPGSPTLTVVGVARSVSETAGGWVVPEQIAALTAKGTSGGYQMLYRLAAADTVAQVEAGRAAVQASVPAAAMTGTRSWLTTRTNSAGTTVLFVPFLIAFGVLGVLMAVLIIGNVIAGAVSTATRRIGILKALGFTPNEVVRAYTIQALIPAAIGAMLGVVAGNLLTIPVLAQTNELYGTADSGVAPWVDAVVLAGALALVTVTAWAAASRAGRLRTVDVLAVGRTPGFGRGHWAARLTARLPLPRPVTLGLAHPFARALRSATIVAAIAFAAAAATFAAGLASSLNEVQALESHGEVVIHPGVPPSVAAEGGPRIGEPPPAPDPAAIVQAITAQPGTSGWSGVTITEVTATGLTDSLEVLAFTGDNSSYGYRMVSGSWFTQPGEIVVATPFLTATRTQVGDTIVLTDRGTQISVRIVGEVFNVENRGMQILTAAATFAVAEPDLRATTYNIALKPGTDAAGYASALNTALTGLGATAMTAENDTAEFVLVINTLTSLLTLLLITVAALGVLNMVVLETSERVHDLGVHKALGMTPRQTIAMVIASVVVTGLIGGAIGAPAGVVLQRMIVGEMGRITGFTLPASVINIYQPAELMLFGLGGLFIAIFGALLPAGWAARTRTATALRTE
jgi:putative ABC transport system permease protein